MLGIRNCKNAWKNIVIWKENRKFDDQHTQFKVKQNEKEIIAWKNNNSCLNYIFRNKK